MAGIGSGVSFGIDFNEGGGVRRSFKDVLNSRTRSDSPSKRKRLEDEPSGREGAGGERDSHEERAFKHWKDVTDWVDAVEVRSKELPTTEPLAIFATKICSSCYKDLKARTSPQLSIPNNRRI